jgi:hypothetical protein
MADEESREGVRVSAKADGVELAVGDRTISRLGSAANWLFPQKHAKAVISAALAERVANKIQSGISLDQQEQYLVSLIFKKQARDLSNQQAVIDRVNQVLPQVESQVRSLPDNRDRGTSQEFLTRAESIASEISEEQIRMLFARVLAGEACRPGTFSIRTLETVRMMDQNVAKIFDRFRCHLFAGDIVLATQAADKLLKDRNITRGDLLELLDASLTDDTVAITIKDHREFIYGAKWKMRVSIHKNSPEVFFPVIRLTRTGREIARVLPPLVDEGYFHSLGRVLSEEYGSKVLVDWRPVNDETWRSF